jgi:hypothetical protein
LVFLVGLRRREIQPASVRRTRACSRPLRAQDRCFFDICLFRALAAADAQAVGLLIIPFSYVILGLLTIGTPDRGPFDMADNITNTASLFSCEEHHGDNV